MLSSRRLWSQKLLADDSRQWFRAWMLHNPEPDPDEIEVTPEMIKAGVRVIAQYEHPIEIGGWGGEGLVHAILEAALKARVETPEDASRTVLLHDGVSSRRGS